MRVSRSDCSRHGTAGPHGTLSTSNVTWLTPYTYQSNFRALNVAVSLRCTRTYSCHPFRILYLSFRSAQKVMQKFDLVPPIAVVALDNLSSPTVEDLSN